jgi:hypothetical protein
MNEADTSPDSSESAVRKSLSELPPTALAFGLAISAVLLALILSALGGPAVGALDPEAALGAGLETPVGRVASLPELDDDSFVLGYVDNLLEKEAAGEWTRGEGLVATLEYISGRRDRWGVLLPEVEDTEATGIVLTAIEYLAAEPDRAVRADLERLVSLFVWDHERLEAMVDPDGVIGASAAPGFARGILAGFQSEQEQTDCQMFYGDEGYRIPDGVEQCLQVRRLTDSGIEFNVYSPLEFEFNLIWDELYVGLVEDTVEETVDETFLALGSLPPRIDIVFSAMWDARALAKAIPQNDGDTCTVTLFPNVFGITDAQFKQTVAHEFGHCFQNRTMPEQQLEYEIRKWREEGFAEYLSAVAYPRIDYELRFVRSFVEDELTKTTVRSRDYRNFVFFQYLYQTWGSDAAIIDFLKKGPTSGDVDDQEDFLRATPNMADLHHGLALTVTDAEIEDRKGGYYIENPEWSIIAEVEDNESFETDVQPFGAARFHLDIPAGKVATASLVTADDLEVSQKAVTGEWQQMAGGGVEWPATCEEGLQYFVVATGIEEPATLEVDVTVEDIPEGDCDTADAVDSQTNADCAVGSWSADLSYLKTALVADTVPGTRTGQVSGTVTMTLEPNGSMSTELNWLRVVTLSPVEIRTGRLLTTMVWDGSGSGTWSAGDTMLTTTVTEFAGDQYVVSRLDGTVVADVKQDIPLGQMQTFQSSGQAPYLCSGDLLHIGGPDGTTVVWTRANKANTIPKG